MLLTEILQEAITFKRLTPAKPEEDDTLDFDIGDIDADRPPEDDLQFPEPDSEFDNPEDADAEVNPEEDMGVAIPGENDDTTSFSTFMGGGGGAGLGSASVSTPQPSEPGGEDEMMGGEGSEDGDSDGAMDQLANKATEDPNKQGLIRNVKGAHLVYKRQSEDGTYDELWVYNVQDGDFSKEIKRRRDILSGTDIPPNKTTSPDGAQSYEIWTTSNAEMLLIKGLPN